MSTAPPPGEQHHPLARLEPAKPEEVMVTTPKERSPQEESRCSLSSTTRRPARARSGVKVLPHEPDVSSWGAPQKGGNRLDPWRHK